MNCLMYQQRWRYYLSNENSYRSSRDAEQVRAMVERNARYDHLRGSGPQRCNCTARAKCGPNSQCPNRAADFECQECRPNCVNNILQRLSRDPNLSPVTVKIDPGMGFGLFSTRRIRANEVIGEYKGEYCTEPFGKQDLESYYVFTLGSPEEQAMAGERLRQLDSWKFGNEFRFANHSCNPNCSTLQTYIGNEIRIGIYALRNIGRNQPITIDYGEEYIQACDGCRCRTCMGVEHNDAEDADDTDNEDDIPPEPRPGCAPRPAPQQPAPGARAPPRRRRQAPDPDQPPRRSKRTRRN